MSFLQSIHDLFNRFVGAASQSKDTPPTLEQIENTIIRLALTPLDRHSLDELTDYLFHQELVVREMAQRSIHEMLKGLSCSELSKLPAFQPTYPSKWYKLKPEDIGHLTTNLEARCSMLGLLSMHFNGHIRQKAVQQLALIPETCEFSFLFLRHNDWVAEIREEVKSQIDARLNDKYASVIASNLDYIFHSLTFLRYKHSSLVEKCVELLLKPEHQPLLRQAVESSNPLVSRSLFKLVFQSFAERSLPMIKLGLHSADPLIRLWCIRQAKGKLPHDELLPILERFQRDPFMPVRRESYLIAAEIQPQQAEGLWKQALLDTSPSVREYAMYYLKKLGSLDLAQHLRQQLQQNPTSPALIVALEQCGDVSDLPLIRDALNTGNTKTRLAAVRTLAKLGQEAVRHELLERMVDPSSKVTHEACYQLIKIGRSISCEQLHAIIVATPYPHVIRAAFQLLMRQSKWEAMPWLIRLFGHPQEQVACEAQHSIKAWFTPPLCNKVYTKPSVVERAEIDKAIEEVRAPLREEYLRLLEQWIDE